MALFDIFKRIPASGNDHDVSHEDMQQHVSTRASHIIDVREPGEFSAGRVKGAVNHPLSKFNPASLPKDKPVILICQAGGRSARAMAQAHAAGRKDVRHYPHGTGGWIGRGGSTDR